MMQSKDYNKKNLFSTNLSLIYKLFVKLNSVTAKMYWNLVIKHSSKNFTLIDRLWSSVATNILSFVHVSKKHWILIIEKILKTIRLNKDKSVIRNKISIHKWCNVRWRKIYNTKKSNKKTSMDRNQQSRSWIIPYLRGEKE